MIIGAVGPMRINPMELLGKRAAVKGWYSGVASDSEDTLLFSQRHRVSSMNEVFPLEEAQAAYDRMSELQGPHGWCGRCLEASLWPWVLSWHTR